MTIERALRGIAGVVILFSLGMAWLVSGIDLGQMSWLWLTIFVGLNLLQSSFTDWCPMVAILRRAGLRHAHRTT